MTKRQRSAYETFVSAPSLDVVRLPGLAYPAMQSFHMDRSAANGKIVDLLAEVEVPSVVMPEMDDLSVWLEKDVGWTQDVGSVDSRLIDTWGNTVVSLLLTSCTLLVHPMRLIGSFASCFRLILRLGPVLGGSNLVSVTLRRRARRQMLSWQRRAAI